MGMESFIMVLQEGGLHTQTCEKTPTPSLVLKVVPDLKVALELYVKSLASNVQQ